MSIRIERLKELVEKARKAVEQIDHQIGQLEVFREQERGAALVLERLLEEFREKDKEPCTGVCDAAGKSEVPSAASEGQTGNSGAHLSPPSTTA